VCCCRLVTHSCQDFELAEPRFGVVGAARLPDLSSECMLCCLIWLVLMPLEVLQTGLLLQGFSKEYNACGHPRGVGAYGVSLSCASFQACFKPLV
jgi:ABC-type sulfate transport system permease component